MVLSHCFTCGKDLKAIVRIARAVAAGGITVLRFDMTGLGDSGGEFSHSDFSTNMDDLRSAIATAETLGPVTMLAGHSFGGVASLAVAGWHRPPHLQHVVTLASPSDTRHLAELLVLMNPSIDDDGIGEVTIGGRRWTIRREMLDDFARHDIDDALRRIDVPVTVMHSPTDATVAYRHAEMLVLKIRDGGHGTGGDHAGSIRGRGDGGGRAELLTLHGDHLFTADGAVDAVVDQMLRIGLQSRDY